MTKARPDSLRRIAEAIRGAADTLLKGVERMVEGLAPQPSLVPVRVRRDRRR